MQCTNNFLRADWAGAGGAQAGTQRREAIAGAVGADEAVLHKPLSRSVEFPILLTAGFAGSIHAAHRSRAVPRGPFPAPTGFLGGTAQHALPMTATREP